MFKKFFFLALCPLFILALTGCAGSSSVNGGLSPVETIVLDDEYNATLDVNKDAVFALDLLRPTAKGRRITGAVFDPEMVRMERYLEYDDDGELRARYLFTALQEGVSDVLIRMVPVAGGDVSTYRQVTVTIGSGGGWFD